MDDGMTRPSARAIYLLPLISLANVTTATSIPPAAAAAASDGDNTFRHTRF